MIFKFKIKPKNGLRELLMIGYPKPKYKKPRQTHPQSILQKKDGTCYLCRKLEHNYQIHKGIEEHHAFPGDPWRQISETMGFKVYLCQLHHRNGPAAVHNNQEMMRIIQRDIQEAFEETHSRKEWMAIMGKSYL